MFEIANLEQREGPHIYRKDGYYYLITAEGGSEYGHAVSIARSKVLTGPYELHPSNPLISARNNPDTPFQKLGHGDIVQMENGEWIAVCLTGRPLNRLGRCTLGRETVLEELIWKENEWPRLKNGTSIVRETFDINSRDEDALIGKVIRDDFEQATLDINFQSLRVPLNDSWVSLNERKGCLRLFGRESLSSTHNQSLVARRVQSFQVEATLKIDFEPYYFQQMAGLVAYYNTGNYYYLHQTTDEKGEKRLLNIVSCQNFSFLDLESNVEIENNNELFLKLSFIKGRIQFYYSTDNITWMTIGGELDGSTLSDDYVRDETNRYRPAFTGSFVGMCCQDLTGQKLHADFDWFEYKELEPAEVEKLERYHSPISIVL